MTLTELQALSDEELNVVVAGAAGYAVVEGHVPEFQHPLYALVRNGERECRAFSEPAAWLNAPDFTRSLDACAPLLDEMAAAARFTPISLEADHVSAGITTLRVTKGLPGKPSEVWPRLICIAYILFKQGQQQK